MGSFGAQSSTSSGGTPLGRPLKRTLNLVTAFVRGLTSLSLPSGCTAVELSVRLAVACLGCALGRVTTHRWCTENRHQLLLVLLST